MVGCETRLANARPIDQIVQLDHLTDIWTTLFFGTGVIWTAIGMRSALIFALGDRNAALQQGAFAMLERMIDGGILLALSTTIFGGIGGYLMRVYKTVTLGTELQQQYDKAARADTSRDARRACNELRRTCVERRSMTRSPLAYPLNRSADMDVGGAADLQTDIMRFMAILSLCLVAIFALVQSIPLTPAEPAPTRTHTGPDTRPTGDRSAGANAGAGARPRAATTAGPCR